MGAARYRSPHPTQERSWPPACTIRTRTPSKTTTAGLGFDLSTLVHRRQALKFLGGAAVVAVAAACGSNNNSDSEGREYDLVDRGRVVVDDDLERNRIEHGRRSPRRPPARSRATAPTGRTCSTESGIVRSDIRSSFGSSSGMAAGRAPSTVEPHTCSTTPTAAPLRRRRGVPVALRPRRQLLDVLAGGADQNYLRGVQEAGERRHGDVHQHLPGRATRAAGRTSTSRCTRAWPRRRRRAHRSRPRSSRCPRTRATSSTRPTATSRASRTWPGPRSPPTWSSATASRNRRPTVTGNVTDGMTIALNVPV